MHMNTLPKYSEQFNKITEAYIKGEIELWEDNFCFCGTLAENTDRWAFIYAMETDYTYQEFGRMEKALFSPFKEIEWLHNGKQNRKVDHIIIMRKPNYEKKLFNGMVAALEVLREIHLEHGEIIDEQPTFKKRQLQSV